MSNAAVFKDLYAKAWAAGVVAASAKVPEPMVVSGMGKSYYVSEGVCGFAWVKVRPGNSAFAKWLVKEKLARGAYNGGVDIWIFDYNQSMDRKEAHARAMSKVLKEAGINAFADSRMD
jgi:hypothetical protein